MSDTVPSAVLVASLGSGGPSFLPLTAPPATDAVHVHGGAYADHGTASLLVEFRTLALDLPSPAGPGGFAAEPPATVSGYMGFTPDATPDVIAGALQQPG